MKRHIKNLDTFRAIAAIVVMIGHIELFRMQQFGSNLFGLVPSGHIAVMMFFVISGFLITFLLTEEKNKYGTISLKDFYVRRILRIWPVYYLVLLLSAFFFEEIPNSQTIVLNSMLLPNIARLFEGRWATSPQIWSIGVENIFYIFLPLILLFISSKRLNYLFVLFIFCFAVLPHFIDFANIRTIQSKELSLMNTRFFFNNKFDSLAIGCLIGHLFATKHSWLKYLYNKYVFWICLLASVVCWVGHIEIKHFNDELMSVLFAVVILNVCTNDALHINIENRFTKFLGKISYGIYMYHWVVLLIAFKLFPLTKSVGSMVVLYCFVIGITILCAWVSFETYEKFFLNLKKKFER